MAQLLDILGLCERGRKRAAGWMSVSSQIGLCLGKKTSYFFHVILCHTVQETWRKIICAHLKFYTNWWYRLTHESVSTGATKLF